MRLQSILSSSTGNLLEWYDFGLYAIYSPLFSRLFFPSEDAHVALIMTFAVLAVGFMCRPVGAFIFGYLGDSRGRAKTLRLSILMISLPTLFIGFLPTYAMAGIIAPLLLIFIRIWQGISLGGEYSGTLIYLTESAPKERRATITSFAATGANLGILLASLVSAGTSYIFSDAAFQSYGWRIPYVLSGFLSLYIYFKRLQMQETSVFESLKKKHGLVKNPITFVLRNNIPQMLRVLGMACMGGTFYYLCFIYMPTFLIQNLHYSITKASSLMTFFIGTMLIFVPLAGMLCDRVSRRKMLLFNAALIAVITIPGFYFLREQHFLGVVLILGFFTIASSLEQAATCVAVVENYPPPARYSGLSIGYNFSYAVFGGTAPLVCEWLIGKTQFLLAPAFYIVMCAIMTGLVIYFFVPDTRGSDLSVGSVIKVKI
jgi:MHS family proline/betaine transporter-like MFS transporter